MVTTPTITTISGRMGPSWLTSARQNGRHTSLRSTSSLFRPTISATRYPARRRFRMHGQDRRYNDSENSLFSRPFYSICAHGTPHHAVNPNTEPRRIYQTILHPAVTHP